jgi:hypothetical protein
VIAIFLDAYLPPSGRIVAGPGQEPKLFDGWLQLLQILGAAITPAPAAAGEVAGQAWVDALIHRSAEEGHADEDDRYGENGGE